MSAKSTSNHDDQQILPFEANDKAELRRMIRAIDWRRSGLSERRWTNCVEVLCYFVGLDYKGIFPRLETISEGCKLGSRRTVGRVIRDLVAIGVLKSRRRGRTSNEYVIERGKLVSLGVACAPDLSTQEAGSVHSNAEFCPLCGSVLSTRKAYNKELTLNLTSSTSSNLGASPSVTSNASLVAEEEEVRKLKNVFRKFFPDALYINAAIDEAMAAGCSIEQLYARGKFFHEHRHEWRQSNRWGALVTGIKLSRPDTPHDRGWPSRP